VIRPWLCEVQNWIIYLGTFDLNKCNHTHTTSRPVAVGSRTYNNLVRDGVIKGEAQQKKSNKTAPALKKQTKDFDTTFSKSGKKPKKQVVYESEEEEFESEPAPLARTKSVKGTKNKTKENVSIPMDEYKLLLEMMNKNTQGEYEYSEDESDYSEDDD
jgi:hypothetical protein